MQLKDALKAELEKPETAKVSNDNKHTNHRSLSRPTGRATPRTEAVT